MRELPCQLLCHFFPSFLFQFRFFSRPDGSPGARWIHFRRRIVRTLSAKAYEATDESLPPPFFPGGAGADSLPPSEFLPAMSLDSGDSSSIMWQ